MNKMTWKPGTMIYPLPAVLVSCGDNPDNYNIITISWTGTICTDPAMCYISIRPSRYSHEIISKSKEFVINLTNKKLAFATDFCGVRSGREINKFKHLKLTPVKGELISAPLIGESPINIECRVIDIRPLGTHDMFISKVLRIHADKKFIDKKGAFNFGKTDPIVYAHNNYYSLGSHLGHFGFSIKKKI